MGGRGGGAQRPNLLLNEHKIHYSHVYYYITVQYVFIYVL